MTLFVFFDYGSNIVCFLTLIVTFFFLFYTDSEIVCLFDTNSNNVFLFDPLNVFLFDTDTDIVC